MQTDILIVGGGLAGVALADHLQRAGRNYLLVEARARLGGRIKTLEAGGAFFDLGPSWFWPGQPRVASLAKRLELEVYEQFSEGAMAVEDEGGDVQYGRGYAAMAGSYRITGGMTALVEGLAFGLDRARLLTGTPIAKIIPGEGALLAEGTAIKSRQTVLALPPRVAATLVFAPDIAPEQRAAMAAIPTWMAGHAKFVAVYQRPFWREAGLSGDAMSRRGPMVEIHDASTASGTPAALFGFLGVPTAQRAGQVALIEKAALAQLARLFGDAALSPLAAQLEDWAFQPETATRADHAPPTHHPAYGLPSALTDIAGGTVHLGSTETASEFGGFTEGALARAEALAQQFGATDA